MKLSKVVRLLLALASGVALALAFPLPNLFLLGWVAIAFLVVAVAGAQPRFALLLGMVQGTASYGLSLPWIYTVLRTYGPLSVAQASFAFGLLVVVGSLFRGAFAVAVAWMSRTCVNRACLGAPLLWVTMEFAILHLPAIAFPWNLLGYIACGNLAFVQLTAVTGIFGLSLAVGAYNGLFAWTALQISKGKRRGVVALLAVTAVLILAGLVGPRFVPSAQPDHIAHLVQTNFPVSIAYPANWMQLHAAEMDELEKISVSAAQREPGVVIWPEVPAPFSLQDRDFQIRAARIARQAGSGFLVGVIDFKPLGNSKTGVTNSAALLGRQGELDFIYDKVHLVPFSEYVPWRKWLFFAKDMTGLIGDFQHGTEYKVGHLGSDSFGVYICYEAIFPNEVRLFARDGAQLLVNISDDGWFGGSGAAAQHMAMARVRAVENRRWLLRATNTGITVSADPYGRIVARLPENIRGELDAPYALRSNLTPYTRWGDWIAWLCVLGALVLVLSAARDARAQKNP